MPKKKVTKKQKQNNLSYQGGNGEQVVVTLLLQIAQKLDNMQNHTATMAEEMIELRRDLKDA